MYYVDYLILKKPLATTCVVRAGSHFDISIGKWKKIPFLVLMLMIMSMNKPITGVML